MNTLFQAPDSHHSLTPGMKELLQHWYCQKYIHHKKTTELMETACDTRNKNALSIVALLDIDAGLMPSLINEEELEFVQTCHAFLRESI